MILPMRAWPLLFALACSSPYGEEVGGSEEPPLGGDTDAPGTPGCSMVTDVTDLGANGSDDFRLRTVYDGEGRVVGLDDAWRNNAGSSSRREQDWDDAGRLWRERRDDDRDGAWNEQVVTTYDAEGNPLLVENDAGMDDTVDTSQAWTYDAEGRWLTHAWSEGGVVVSSQERTYDDAGRMLRDSAAAAAGSNREERWTYGPYGLEAHSYDEDGIRYVDEVWTWEVDGLGNVASGDGVWSAADGVVDVPSDGVVDWRSTSTYDGAGNLLSLAYDAEADGTVDTRKQYTWDGDGRKTGHSYDSDGDGLVDEGAVYAYDADGNLAWRADDTDGDGAPNRTWRYTWNAAGQLTAQEDDYDGNGVLDRALTWAYDAAGNLLEAVQDGDGDGDPDEVDAYTYDDGNRELTHSRDVNGDGHVERVYTHSYDTAGNPVLYETVQYGVVTDRETWLYNAAELLLAWESDDGADGEIDKAEIRTWDEAARPLSAVEQSRGLDSRREHWSYASAACAAPTPE
jgi:YD repeat-containing protein